MTMNWPKFEQSPGFSKVRGGAIAMAIAIASAFGPVQACLGELIIQAPDLSLTAGASGSFDLTITNTNPLGGSSYNIASDVLQVALSNATGVEFTSASITTADTYLYEVSGTSGGGGSLSSDPFPNTGFTASDSEFAFASIPNGEDERTIMPGETFGILHVTYTVSAQAAASSGMIEIITNPDGTGTSLSDDQLNLVTFSSTDGTITLTPQVVPEPSTLLLSIVGGACLLAARSGAKSTRSA